MSVYFVRHGESTANAEYKVSDDSVELTETGREQAHAAVDLLKDKNITGLLASPLIRARQTAEIIANELGGMKTVVLDGLRERDLGNYKGLPRPENGNFFYEIDDDNGVESRQDLIKRVESVLRQVAAIEVSADGNILVVGHAITGFFMRNAAKGISRYEDFDWSLKIRNSEVVEMEMGESRQI